LIIDIFKKTKDRQCRTDNVVAFVPTSVHAYIDIHTSWRSLCSLFKQNINTVKPVYKGQLKKPAKTAVIDTW